MERRDRSLKALKELTYIDSLDSFAKADALVKWFDTYLKDDSIENFDLELNDLKRLEELFFKNINFLKNHKEDTRQELVKMQKMKRFLKN
jgi:acyl carrier protein